MKTKFYTLFILLAVTFFFSCKTATKLYNKGNYDEAVELAAKKLQKKPDDAEMQDLIRSAYQYAVNDHESNIRSHSNSTNELKWEWMYNEYSALQNLYNVTKGNITVSSVVNPVDYSSYVETYRDKAAEIRIERGDNWFSQDNRQAYKNAFYEYRVADGFKHGSDISLKNKMTDAYEMAVINVVVLQMNDNRYRYSSYNSNNSIRNLDDEILRQLKYNTGNDFVRFYSEGEARSNNARPDQFIDMRFSNFNIGRTRDVTKRIVVKETVYRPDSIVYEYKDVKARITTTKRTMLSEGFLQVNVKDEDGRWLWSDELRGEHNWCSEFATYTGDERALSETDKQLINRQRENPPFENDIIRTIVNNIDNGIAGRLRNYYSRF
jgi:hypothetical protein